MLEQLLFQTYMIVQSLVSLILMLVVLGLAGGVLAAALCLPSWYLFERLYLRRVKQNGKTKSNNSRGAKKRSASSK